MDAQLVDIWLGDGERIEVIDEASVAVVRERVREVCRDVGLGRTAAEELVVCASELARNQLRHGGGMRAMSVLAISRAGAPAVEVVAADAGPGITRPADAFGGARASSGGLGVGLAGVRRLADELDVDVRLGEGTCLRARKLASPGPRRREIGIYGRPCDGFSRSGDAAYFAREGGRLFLAVVDGLGHGDPARESALAAVRAVRAASGSPRAALEECSRALASVRGGVVACVQLDEETGAAEHAIVGDVRAVLAEPGSSRTLRATRGFLGRGAGRVRIREEAGPLAPGEVAMLATDGVSRSLDLGADPSLLVQAPIAIAEAIVARHGKSHDDALVLVAR